KVTKWNQAQLRRAYEELKIINICYNLALNPELVTVFFVEMFALNVLLIYISVKQSDMFPPLLYFNFVLSSFICGLVEFYVFYICGQVKFLSSKLILNWRNNVAGLSRYRFKSLAPIGIKFGKNIDLNMALLVILLITRLARWTQK
ncbi:unnamed protein product, partial [Allacma fusca]